MEDHYIQLYGKYLNDRCFGCKFCDFRTLSVVSADETYHGYDGTSMCLAFDKDMPKGENNTLLISALWKKCTKFQKADKYDYIKEMAVHLAFACYAYNSPDDTVEGETKEEVFNNTIELYSETIKLYSPKNEIKYSAELFDKLADIYNDTMNQSGSKLEIKEREIYDYFIKKFY